MKETVSTSPLSFALRPYAMEDDAFLYELYCSTRIDEVASLGWSDAQRDMFFRLQFQARQQSFRVHENISDHRIILIEEHSAGHLLIYRLDDEIRLADIALLPQYRNRGAGAILIRELQSEAEAAGLPLRLHVTHTNPALRLYERLGFVKVLDTGTHFRMEWNRKL